MQFTSELSWGNKHPPFILQTVVKGVTIHIKSFGLSDII